MTVAHTEDSMNVPRFTEIQMGKGYGGIQNKYLKKQTIFTRQKFFWVERYLGGGEQEESLRAYWINLVLSKFLKIQKLCIAH